MDKKINTNVGITILLVTATLLIFIDFIIMDKELNKKGYQKNNNTYQENVFDQNIQNKLETIIKDELYVFGGKNNINDITNTEKLFLSYKNTIKFEKTNNFQGDIISNWFKNSSLSKLKLELEDIMYYDSNCVMYKYDEISNSYNKQEECGFGKNFVDIAYTDISNYTLDNDKYHVFVKYLWYVNEPAEEFSLYGKYNDAYNMENSIITENINEFNNANKMKNIIDNNNVETYNYIFEKENNSFKLIELTRID